MRKHADEPLGDSPRIAAAAADHGRDWTSALLLLATVAFLISYLPLIPRRIFDPDEFEHAHAAWCWWKGMIPYKDFFEHHTPWYYAVLRPLFRWFDVDASLESARHFLLLGRSGSDPGADVPRLVFVLSHHGRGGAGGVPKSEREGGRSWR